ncbi:MAG: tetratricopeptide repeat protein [Pyrinomonadaceae bacterium]
MSRYSNLFLILLVLVFFNLTSFGQNKDTLAEAERLYLRKQYMEALSVYQKLLNETSDTTTRTRIIFNLGSIYRELKQYDKSIEIFRQILETRNDNQTVNSNAIQMYRGYQARAQWEIGNSLFTKGDYEGALTAYHTIREKYPYFLVDCTGAQWHELILREAVSLEHLKRYREAINTYFQLNHPRIVELYEANGQLADLKAILAKKNEPLVAEWQKKYAWTREKALEELPTRRLYEFIEIYDLEKAGNITALMNLARRHSKNDDRQKRKIIVEMLARHPSQSVQLANAVLRTEDYSPYLFYQVMGRAGTVEAVAILEERAEKVIDYDEARFLVEALSFAGELGGQTLEKLEQKNLSRNMEYMLQRYKKGDLSNELVEKIRFPPVPNVKLPIDL